MCTWRSFSWCRTCRECRPCGTPITTTDIGTVVAWSRGRARTSRRRSSLARASMRCRLTTFTATRWPEMIDLASRTLPNAPMPRSPDGRMSMRYSATSDGGAGSSLASASVAAAAPSVAVAKPASAPSDDRSRSSEISSGGPSDCDWPAPIAARFVGLRCGARRIFARSPSEIADDANTRCCASRAAHSRCRWRGASRRRWWWRARPGGWDRA